MRTPFILLSLALTAIVGCGGSGTTVSGKVTFEGKPVAGTIKFHGAQERVGTLKEDGSYLVEAVSEGTNKVSIVGIPKGPVGAPDGAAKKADIKDAIKPPASNTATPPAKYADKNNGLTFEVASGRNQKDFELEK